MDRVKMSYDLSAFDLDKKDIQDIKGQGEDVWINMNKSC